MPALEVKLYLLKQSASITSAMGWAGEFIQQSVHGSFARAIASKGCKVGIHHLLGFDEGAEMIRARKADEEANRFAHVVHTKSSAARR